MRRSKSSLYHKKQNSFQASKTEVLVLPLDLEKSSNFPEKVVKVVSKFKCIDLLINNGGISQRSRACETSIEVDRKIMEVNYFGTMNSINSVYNYYKDKNAGQQYLEQSGLADKYEIDNQLSNEKGIVVVDKKTGKVKVAYRGTDKSNLNDLEADARIAVGSEASHNHFTDAREQMKATIDKYGFDNVERVVGYSLGGTKSYTMGKAFKIPSRSFNPFIAGNNLTDGENFNSEEHEIFRTQDDIASFAAPRIEGRNNTSLNVVEALHGTVNPYKTHKLENFTTNTGRTGDKTSVIESKSRDIVEHSLEHGELKTLHDMIKVNKRTGLKITEVSSKTPITSKSNIGLMPPPASTETRTENPLFEKPTRIETQNPLFEPPKRLSTVDKSFQDLLQQQELIQKDKASQKQAILESDAKILSTKKPSISVDENGNLDTSTKPKVFKRSFKSSVRRKTMAPNTEIELKTLIQFFKRKRQGVNTKWYSSQ